MSDFNFFSIKRNIENIKGYIFIIKFEPIPISSGGRKINIIPVVIINKGFNS